MRVQHLLFLACALHVSACSESSPSPASDVPAADGSLDVPADAVIDTAPDSTAPDSTAPDSTAPDSTPTDLPGDLSPAEGGADCVLPGYGLCVRGTTCVIARCPDGTPVSCFCSLQGEPRCTGACPPPPDAGVTCGVARVVLARPPCAPARPTLDPMICRCILGYSWDGNQCASLANCHCYAGCDEVYETREACQVAHAHCGDAGR